MSNSHSGYSAIHSLFQNRNYTIYTTGNVFSLVGVWVQRLAVGWLAWDLTKSGFWLGAVAFADLFPVIMIAPFAGVIADRYDRRMILLFCTIMALIQSAVLCFLTVFDWISIYGLFLLTLFHGIVIALNMPSRLSLVHSLVRARNMASAIAINSVMFNLARFIGPAVAGVVITAFGIAAAFAVNAITFLVMLLALLFLRLPPQEMASKRERKGIVTDALQGIRYAISHPVVIQTIVFMLAASFLCRPVFELLPGFADEVFHQGAAGLSILTSAVGFGAIAGGIWIAQRGKHEGLLTIMMVSLAISGLMLILFASTDLFWIAVVAMGISGVTMVTFGVSTQTLIQNAVSGKMRGRVLGLWGMIFRGGPAIGALMMGWLSGFFGLQWPVGVGGGLCILVILFMWMRTMPLLKDQEVSTMPPPTRKPVG